MKTKFIEVTNEKMNWGKFMVAKFEEEEWAHTTSVGRGPLLGACGWDQHHYWVVDLQTGEGGIFRQGGCASADLEKHRIWVCPMFEPFLTWLYQQDLTDLDALPPLVEFSRDEAPFAMTGYRRPGPEPA